MTDALFDPNDKSRDPDLIPRAPVIRTGVRWDILFSHSPTPMTLHVLDEQDRTDITSEKVMFEFESGTKTVLYLAHVACIMRTPYKQEVKDKKSRSAGVPPIRFKGDERPEGILES